MRTSVQSKIEFSKFKLWFNMQQTKLACLCIASYHIILLASRMMAVRRFDSFTEVSGKNNDTSYYAYSPCKALRLAANCKDASVCLKAFLNKNSLFSPVGFYWYAICKCLRYISVLCMCFRFVEELRVVLTLMLAISSHQLATVISPFPVIRTQISWLSSIHTTTQQLKGADIQCHIRWL